MHNRFCQLWTLILALAPSAVPAAEEASPASRWIPSAAIATLELRQPEKLIDTVASPKIIDYITSHPLYQQVTAQPGFKKFLGGVQYLEGALATDWRTGLRNLIGGGVTLALGPHETSLLIVEAKDAQMLDQLHAIILNFSRADANAKAQPERVSPPEHEGVTIWSLNENETHAIVGKRFLLSNRLEVLKAALDLGKEGSKSAESLSSVPEYRAARKAAGKGSLAFAYANLKILKEHPPFRKALTDAQNPLASLLFAPVTTNLLQANWLALGLRLRGPTVSLTATTDSQKVDLSLPTSFGWSKSPKGGAWPLLSVPRRIASVSLYRDLPRFYYAKDDLFPERTSGLIFFENMMAIFFSGRNFAEEVLAETHPEMRLVVAEQKYSPSIGTPQAQIPAFALILRLRRPDHFSEVVEEAWQKALGLINFTRGQQALPGLIIDRLTHDETKFTLAYFSAVNEKDRENLDLRFNFRPSVAVCGESLILSSTDELTRDLLYSLKKEKSSGSEPLARVHTALDIDGPQILSVLEANRENLILQNMVKDGHSREQAETQIGLLFTVLKQIGGLELTARRPDSGKKPTYELKLTLKPELPQCRLPAVQNHFPGEELPMFAETRLKATFRPGSDPGEDDNARLTDPGWAWAPYVPSPHRPWNLARAGHLLRRATFGADWSRLQKTIEDGPELSVKRLLRPEGDLESSQKSHDKYEETASRSDSIDTLRSWWLRRMALSPHPLLEKLTLFWHDHFAVSGRLVKKASLLQKRTTLLRRQALGRFDALLKSICYDPATLIGLDATAHRKGQPCDYFAKVLMEHYTLGSGNFTETDVREVARAFTGGFIIQGEYRSIDREHDSGPKIILGRSGAWKGDDAVRILLEQPALSRCIVQKLYRFLISEAEAPAKALIKPLAESFAKDYDVAQVVETMLRSNLFFSPAAFRRRVKSPIELALGVVKALEGSISTTMLGSDLAVLGQDLYRPPSSQGWNGGLSWIHSLTILGRHRLTEELLSGSGKYKNQLNPLAVARKHGHEAGEDAGRFLLDLLLPGEAGQDAQHILQTYSNNQADLGQLRQLAYAITTLPEFQLA